MLECRIINGHPWSIGCGDPNPSKRGEDAALMSDLPVEIQHKVSDWILGKLWKRNTPNYDSPDIISAHYTMLTLLPLACIQS